MTVPLSISTATPVTGEHPVYQRQEETRTYETTDARANDTPRETPVHADFVVLTTPPTTTYIHTSINVATQALRRAIAALNEELRQRV